MEEKKKIRIVFTILFVLAVLVTGYYQYAFEKFEATWWGISIYVWALLIGIPVALGMNFLNYIIADYFGTSFDYKRFIPGPYMYGFLTIGCLLSLWLGIRFTEPNQDWSSGHTEVSQNDRYYHSSFYQWYYHSSFGGNGGDLIGSSSSSSSSSSDDSGKAIAYVVLILIVVLILVLSATVKHFWVVGSITIILMMGQYLYRVWTLVDDEPRNRFMRR